MKSTTLIELNALATQLDLVDNFIIASVGAHSGNSYRNMGGQLRRCIADLELERANLEGRAREQKYEVSIELPGGLNNFILAQLKA